MCNVCKVLCCFNNANSIATDFDLDYDDEYESDYLNMQALQQHQMVNQDIQEGKKN